MGIYEGDFKDGLMEGRGKHTWADGEVYEGEFKKGVAEGNGMIILPNGAVFEGQFHEGNAVLEEGRTGKKRKTHNGIVYEQDIDESEIEVLLYDNGDYRGNVKRERGSKIREGKGKYAWGNGNTY
ncbi:MAG: hypothetical protein LBG13_02340, partial [Holosporales bacterium]|nr:hypothetical protein [Holosporales bacterium]